jgi:hypothetical protein
MQNAAFPWSRVLLLVAALPLAGTTRAASWVVNTTASNFDGLCNTVHCSIIDAILEAQANPGPDDVFLQACATYAVSAPYGLGSAFPVITTPVRIVGHGAVIERLATAPDFRFFDVTATGDLTLESLTLRRGKSPLGGGAVRNGAGQLAIANCILEDNVVDGTNGSWQGGAIYSAVGALTVDHSTIRRSSAVVGGGIAVDGWMNQTSTVTIRNSSIVDNSALDYSYYGLGGGILLRGHVSATIEDTTIAGNIAQWDGGGIYFHSIPDTYAVLLRNVTIVNNAAQGLQGSPGGAGGGLHWHVCGGTCPIPTLPIAENSIIANNTAVSAPDWLGSYVSNGWNIIGPGGGSFPPTTGDQLVATLANLSGRVDLGEAGGQHHPPLAGCTAINTANPGLCAAVDQIDLDRVATCEKGAIEYRECVPAPADLVDWWPFNEAGGPTAADVVATPNDGAHVNGPAPAPGMVRGSLCFDGVNQAVHVPDHPEVDFLGDCSDDAAEPFTIDTWVKTCATGRQVILDKRDAAANFLRGYELFLIDGRLGFQMATGPGNSACGSVGSACDEWISPPPGSGIPDLRDQRWHFVAVTVTRCHPAVGKMYIDGSLVLTFTARVGDISSAADLQIGESYPVPTTTYFEGCLDELEIFKRDLSQPELDAIADAGWAGKCQPACTESPYPQCDGPCPNGLTCLPDTLLGECKCVDYVPPCEETEPTCHGPCPLPGEVCVNKPGVGCYCSAPTQNCVGSDAPQCNGVCPNPSHVCRPVLDADACHCAPLVVGCANATVPACAGVCPPGEQCKSGGLASCQCVPCDTDTPEANTTLLAVSRDVFHWSRLECATGYNLYRLVGAQLPDADRDGLAEEYGSCIGHDLTYEETTDLAEPLPAELHFYLVTGENPLGEGSLGLASTLQERPNVAPCP